ncbi:DNA (cytosine-5-)-methyltransferase [Bacillus pumilus]|uniref:DNA cytosine methyltransferase n=1 Tax=Bacillus pumilus TaxID=1408 RepID=UPI000D041EF3|nr:DNA cytosine methyltransferase [Bacillus pumilus]PRS11594.1 DNA (cytosine-5-)-methyltransferase [Bacillus pumilus]
MKTFDIKEYPYEINEDKIENKINNGKINTKGRGKFKPAPNLEKDEIKKILMEKIADESKVIVESDKDEELLAQIDYRTNKFNVVSLFSGCGGLDLGFELAGLSAVIGEEAAMEAFKDKELFTRVRHQSVFHTIYTNDLFKEANQTYKLNFPEHVVQHERDIKKVANFPLCNIMLGGFPCPGFSEAGPRLVDDKRNFLYLHFIRALLQTQPEFFIAENVKGMMTLGQGEVLSQIIEDFSSTGYKVTPYLVNARDFGVPQYRERVFLIGVHKDKIIKKHNFKYPEPNPIFGEGIGLKPYVTLKDAIGDLENNPGPYFKGSYSTIYMSRNRKKQWDDQSFTIQASGRQAPMHPSGDGMEKIEKNKWGFVGEFNRRLSVKEISRIQTFPDWYEFMDGGSSKMSVNGRLDKIYKQIGNAVPVILAKEIARPIAEFAYSQLENGESERLYVQTSLF